MPYVIAEPCINVKDKACVEVCPVDCIYEGETMLYIHPDECIDCGACEPVCPVKAMALRFVHRRHASWAGGAGATRRAGDNPRISAVAHPLRFPRS